MHIIKRHQADGGGYVKQPGSAKAYTNRIEKAQKFKTEEDAQANCCGNEYPMDLDRLLSN